MAEPTTSSLVAVMAPTRRLRGPRPSNFNDASVVSRVPALPTPVIARPARWPAIDRTRVQLIDALAGIEGRHDAFSEPVTGVSAATATLKNAAGAAIAATVTYDGQTRVATVNPTADLAADTRFTVTFAGGPTAIRDAAGNALTTTGWTFLTGPRPWLTAKSPGSGATSVARTANVLTTYSESVNGVSSSTFTLRNTATGAAITVVVSRNGTTNQWILNPRDTLTANTRYTVTVTGGPAAIRDVAGNPMTTRSWAFTTGA